MFRNESLDERIARLRVDFIKQDHIRDDPPAKPSSSSSNEHPIATSSVHHPSTSLKRHADASTEPPTVPEKQQKISIKHSFAFISINKILDDNDEKNHHCELFQQNDNNGLKEQERKAAYQELASFCQVLWPSPRKIMKDDVVTAKTINEFIKDDVYQVMFNKALNNSDLFEAHELIFSKKSKPN